MYVVVALRVIDVSSHVIGFSDEFKSKSSVYPLSLSLHDIGYTEDQLSNS